MLPQDQIDALRAKHGRVKCVTYNGQDFVFRKPTRMEVIQYRQEIDDPGQKLGADEKFATTLVVHPTRDAFASFCEEWPYAPQSTKISASIAQLSGLTEDEEAKSSGTASRSSGRSPTHSPEA